MFFLKDRGKATAAYHPQTNGITDLLNYTLGTIISTYLNDDHSNWDSILLYVSFAYNTAHDSTTGFPPSHILYARDLIPPLDTVLPYTDHVSLDTFKDDVLYRAEDSRQLARHRTLKSQQEQQYRHPERNRHATFEIGDEGILWTPICQPGQSEKPFKKCVGPYIVLRRMSPRNYEVPLVFPPRDQRTKQTNIVHIVGMKPNYRDQP